MPIDPTSSLKNLHAIRRNRGKFRGYFGESLTPDGSEGSGSVPHDLLGTSAANSSHHGESIEVAEALGAVQGRMHPGNLDMNSTGASTSHSTEDEVAPEGYVERIRSPGDVPEHLSSSPLCPRHPRHPSKGTSYCPYHDTVWGVERKPKV
jgi:hypothetical protein